MEAVIEAVKKIENAPADTEVRNVKKITVGQAIQQGDIYIHRVSERHSRGKALGKNSVQVALGVGNGARHMACGKISVFEGCFLPNGVGIPDVDASVLCGPVIVAEGPWMLTHPEHAHFAMPAGTYQTTYQYDPKTMRRVQD